MEDENKPVDASGDEPTDEEVQQAGAEKSDSVEVKVEEALEASSNTKKKNSWKLSKKYSIFLAAFILLAGGAYYYNSTQETEDLSDVAIITNYEECVAAGHPIMESFPEKCAVPDGLTFTRVLDEVVADEVDDEVVEGCGELATYTNEEIGFEFCYPVAWGEASFADEEEALSSGMGHQIDFADEDNAGATIRTNDWQTEFGRGGGYFDSPLVFSTDFTPSSEFEEDFVNVSVLLDEGTNTLVTAYCSDFLGAIAVDALVEVGSGDYDAMKFYYLFRTADETGIDFEGCDDLATLIEPIGQTMIEVADTFKLI